MKLAIDVRSLQDKQWTGVSEYTWQVVKNLQNISEGKPILFSNSFKTLALPQLDKYGTGINSKIPSRVLNLLWKFNAGTEVDKFLGLMDEDVFWLTNPHFIKLSSKVKKVITLHDLSFLHFPQFFSTKKRWWYVSQVINQLKHINEFDLILCVSENTKKDLFDFVPNIKSRVEVVYPGIDDSYISRPNTDSLLLNKKKYLLPNDYILAVGSIEPRKNHLSLLKAFEILCNDNSFKHDLVIAGPLGWSYQPFFQYWKSMKNNSRVHWLKYVPRADLRLLYAGADMFTYPSYYEGFGFPVLEALSQGVKTIVANTSSLPEIVKQHSLLANPWRIDEWVVCIKSCLNGEDGLDLQKGADYARTFTWDKSVKKMYNYIKEI